MLNFLKRRKTEADEMIITRNKEAMSLAQFNNALDFAKDTIKCTKDDNDKHIILDFLMDAVRTDLQAECLSSVFYDTHEMLRKIDSPIPLYYYDEKGIEQSIVDNGEKVTVNLSKTCVFVMPWEARRMRNSILNIYKNAFEYDESNHRAYLFTDLNLIYIYNGNHSSAAGVHYKKGNIKAKTCEVKSVFPHLHTEGVNWINSHSGQVLKPLVDFRIGILYETLRLRATIGSLSSQNIS